MVTMQRLKDLNTVVETENNLLRKRIAELEEINEAMLNQIVMDQGHIADMEAENKRLKEILPGEGWKGGDAQCPAGI